MQHLNPEAELALTQTIAVWKFMLKKDCSKHEAMKQLFPQYYNLISCNCFLCQYTKPFVEAGSVSEEYNCDYCPAGLACDEPNSDYNAYLSENSALRHKAIQSIINRCKAALTPEGE